MSTTVQPEAKSSMLWRCSSTSPSPSWISTPARWKPSPTIFLVAAEESDDDDEGPDLPNGRNREWEIAKRVVSTDRFRKLPTKFDVHEWEIMLEFSESMEREKIREDLLYAIHGAGAFRDFKAAIRRHRIEPAWFAFRAEALRQIAIDWCEENRHRLGVGEFPGQALSGQVAVATRTSGPRPLPIQVPPRR